MARAEVIAQVLGFPPERALRSQEEFYMTQEVVRYYEILRRDLMQKLDHYRMIGDEEGVTEIRRKIAKFNKTIPHKGFSITGESIKQSLTKSITDRRRIEAGIFTRDKAMSVQRQVQSGFTQEGEESKTPLTDDEFMEALGYIPPE